MRYPPPRGGGPDRPPPEQQREAAGLSRRRFLFRSGTVLASGFVAARLGAGQPALAHGGGDDGHGDLALSIWAATRDGDGGYVALAGDAADPDIARLVVEGDGAVRLGTSLGVRLPDGFVPLALLATGGRLLVAGATVREESSETLRYGQAELLPGDRDGVPTDEGFLEGSVVVPTYSVRPGLVEVTADGTRTLPLEAQAPAGFGVATAVLGLPGGRLAAVVEGAGAGEQAYNDVTRLAESAGADGAAWHFETIADRLGEGHDSHVVTTGGRLLAVTVDQDGRREFFERAPRRGAPWRRSSARVGSGPLMAAVPRRGDVVEIVSGTGGEPVRLRQRAGSSGWRRAGTVEIPGDEVLDVVAVSGTRGDLVALGRSGALLVG